MYYTLWIMGKVIQIYFGRFCFNSLYTYYSHGL
jgi:hypothetical protein